MSEYTLGKAAKIWGLHRTTLYAAIKHGRLSVGLNGNNQKVVSLGEMIRVFSNPPAELVKKFDSSTASSTTVSTPDSTVSSTASNDVLQPLLQAIERLEATVKSQQEVIKRNTAKIEELTTALLRIEYKPDVVAGPTLAEQSSVEGISALSIEESEAIDTTDAATENADVLASLRIKLASL